jgi:hypothetical protein
MQKESAATAAQYNSSTATTKNEAVLEPIEHDWQVTDGCSTADSHTLKTVVE